MGCFTKTVFNQYATFSTASEFLACQSYSFLVSRCFRHGCGSNEGNRGYTKFYSRCLNEAYGSRFDAFRVLWEAKGRGGVLERDGLNPLTPKSDQCQMSPAASPEI